MKCADFQKALPYMTESGPSREQQEHLQKCPVCSDLVADLNYIAEAAKHLVPMKDPSPRVWEGIQRTLEKQGGKEGSPSPKARRAVPWA